MGSNGKKKTTFAKLAREAKLRERRSDKEVRKRARRLEATTAPSSDIADLPAGTDDRPESDGD
ncbi:MAG: hypothetical protein NVS4B5_22230 [Vulcanimicrobiaceae bacterium]